MKKIIFACFIFLSLGSIAQKVVVSETEERVDEMKRKGLSILLELDEADVKREWQKKLREFGSYKTKGATMLVEQANIPSVSLTPVKVISTVKNGETGTKVWLAIDLGDSYVTADGDKTKFNEASKILHDFGVNLYIQDINEQIREAEKVLGNSVKEQERLMLRGENIKRTVVKNRLEKVRLEQKLHDNDSTYKLIRADSLQNVNNQKASTENVEKMKRAVDLVKSKITKVE